MILRVFLHPLFVCLRYGLALHGLALHCGLAGGDQPAAQVSNRCRASGPPVTFTFATERRPSA